MGCKNLQQSLQNMKDDAESKHYRNHPDHARVLLDQLWREIGSFLERRTSDPLLFAYSIRDVRPNWTGEINEIFAWADAVLDADGPDVESEGVR